MVKQIVQDQLVTGELGVEPKQSDSRVAFSIMTLCKGKTLRNDVLGKGQSVRHS